MLKDGVYFDLDERAYHAENRLSASAIKQIVESPTAYWFNSRLNPLFEEKKDGALLDGSLFHAILLEPEAVAERYAIPTRAVAELNKNSTAWKTWRAAEETAGRIVVDYEKAKLFRRIAAYLRTDGQVLDTGIFSGGFAEISILWTESDGIQRKARIDYLSAGRLVDLKTFQKRGGGSLGEFVRRYFYEYRVHIQMVYYLRALKWAQENGLPVYGTDAQKEFWDALPPDPLPFVVFVSRDLPLARIVAFVEEKARDMYQLARDQIAAAERAYCANVERYGFNNAWLEINDGTTADDMVLTDADFPRVFYDRLNAGECEE